MSIIYSRPRLRIPKIICKNQKNMKHNKRKVTILMIFFIAFATLKIILDAVTPIFNTLCENKALSLATSISNNKATEVMQKHSYDELYTIEKNESGNISGIKANIIQINEITGEIALQIQNEINNQGRDNVEIALRKFYRDKIISRERTWNTNKDFFKWKCKD